MTTPTPKKIALITGSTRPIRVIPNVTTFIANTISTSPSFSKITLSTIDNSTFNLPIFDEKVLPKLAPLEHIHSKTRSQAMKPHDGYIVVTPEYNAGIPGGLKNAFDYLYYETVYKPVAVVSYGGHGGSNASKHLNDVLTRMEMKVMETRPQLAFAGLEEMKLAVTDGKIGEATLSAWEKEQKRSVVKAFEELDVAVEVEFSPVL